MTILVLLAGPFNEIRARRKCTCKFLDNAFKHTTDHPYRAHVSQPRTVADARDAITVERSNDRAIARVLACTGLKHDPPEYGSECLL